MYVFGTVNPDGEGSDHTGVFLKETDIDDIISDKQLYSKPVLLEHKGEPVGKVVSAWKNNKRLDCVFEINDSVAGLFAQHFVKNGKTTELSLGYTVDIEHSANGVKGGTKRIVEVSIVKKGARDHCKIHGFNSLNAC